MNINARIILYASAAFSALATPAIAQDAPAAEEAEAAEAQPAAAPAPEEIVITGVATSKNRLDASVSTTSLSADAIAESAPRSAAEVLRNLPGIRSEASGGEGNANINVRGLPVSTGGAKFLQLQEDSLPLLEFGDIIFGNADIFLRLDSSVARVESIRGGSASTFASNSPGGIVNFITKTGKQAGGSVIGTIGLDYGEYRADVEYGGRISDSTYFHVGGFYRVGEGPREAGYNGNKGGQIRASLTHELGGRGYVRLNFKYLNDRSIAYLPSPVQVTGSNGDPDYKNIPGLDANNETLHSKHFLDVLGLTNANTPTISHIDDGMHPIVASAGLEVSYDIADGFNITNRFRASSVRGRFISPFPAGVDAAQVVADSIGGAGSTLWYASGPNAGTQVTNPSTLGGNGLLVPIVLFNTKLDNLDYIVNDLRLNKEIELGSGKLDLTAGLYLSRQNIGTTWMWTSHLLTAEGDNAVLIDVRNALGVPQTEDGTVAYGASFFGNCCRRQYDLNYETLAPFVSVGFETGGLNVDASIRFDNGWVGGSAIADGPLGSVDVNRDGVISVPESQSTLLSTARRQDIDYNYDYISYSLGANYRFSPTMSAFARYSRGGRANADRLIFGPAIAADGDILDSNAAVDFVNQLEAGVKYRRGGLELYLTAFHSRTEETNFDFGLGFFSNKYRATGLEAEGAWRHGIFELRASGTYTDAKIISASASPALEGNRPRRQAEFVYQVSPQVRTDRWGAGFNIVGTTDSYAQDNNVLKLPGYTVVNAFASVKPLSRVELRLNANNLFNVNGFTEAEEGAIPGNGYIRARSINGRTVSLSAQLDF